MVIKIGLVGAGYIALRKHLPIWKSLSGTEVVAISDLDERAARDACEEHGIADYFTDTEEMLLENNIDIVDICTPPQTHTPLGKLVLSHDTNALVEKSLALSAAEAEELLEATSASEGDLCTVHQMLFYPPVRKARKHIQSGDIGDVQGMRLFLSTPADKFLLDERSWIHNTEGGLLTETGPHAIYLAQDFVGDIADVEATGRKFTDVGWVDWDNFFLNLDGELGTASIRIIHNSNYRAAELDVFGREGRLKLDLQTMQIHQFTRESLDKFDIARSAFKEGIDQIFSTVSNGVSVLTNRFISGHQALMDGFVSSVRTGTPPSRDSRGGLRNRSVIERSG